METIPLQTEKRLDWGRVLVAMIAVSFAFRVYVMLDPRQEPSYELLFSLLYVAAAACTLQCARFRGEFGCKLMLGCLAWSAISCAIPAYEEREVMQLSYYFLMMLFAFFVCFPLAFVLPEGRVSRALTVLAAVEFILIAGLALTGLVAALTGTVVPSLAGPDYITAGMDGGRLSLFCYPTMSSALLCIGLILGLYLFLRAKGALLRAVCAVFWLALFAALSLTDSRTSCVFFSVCFGGFFYLIAAASLPLRKRALRILAAAGVAGVAVLACYGGLRLGYRALASAVPARQSAVIAAKPERAPAGAATVRLANKPRGSEAAATETPDGETPEPQQAAPQARSLFENLSTLQGRTYVWEAALRALQSEPMLLLTGASPLFVMERVEPYVQQTYGDEMFPHLHSIFFQTLVAYGLPGLLLFAALVFYILFHALRVFFCGAEACSLAERTLPLLLLFFLATDLLETFLSFFDVVKHANPWFFLVGGYVVWLSKTRIAKKAHKQPAA